MPTRVLHIVTCMDRAGLETMLMNYYRFLDRERIQFDFLTHRDFTGDYDEEIQALGGRIYRLPRLNPFSRTYRNALDRFFAEHPGYRIVHCHLDCMAGLPLKYAKKHGIPLRIAHAHSSSQTRDFKYPLKLMYKRVIPRYATHLFACGQAAGRWMFGGADFRVLNNAIDAARFAFDAHTRHIVRAELDIPADALVVGHVGRFMIPKNQGFLLRIFARLPENTRLLLVGDGELREETETLAAALGIRERVLFAGLREDVERLLQAMDVFVLPSLYEGLPLSVLEAQAAGLPCLISDRVPPECQKTPLVTRLPLEAPADAWAEAMVSAKGMPGIDPVSLLRRAGFDIRENARALMEFYEQEV